MDLNTSPTHRVSIGEKMENAKGVSYPKALNHFNFKKISDRKGSGGYPPASKIILDAFSPVEGRGRYQPKEIRLTFAASTPELVSWTGVGEYGKTGYKWRAVDPYNIQWTLDQEPIIDEVFEKQTDGTMDIVKFDPDKHLAGWRKKKFSLRSTSVYGFLEVKVHDEWVKDPEGGFWKLSFGSEQSTQSLFRAFQSMKAQAMVDLLVEASGKTVAELANDSIQDVAGYRNIAECYSLMGRTMEFYISSWVEPWSFTSQVQ